MTILAAARSLLGPGVAVAGGAVADWDGPIPPEEEAAALRMVPRRRAEFAAGRRAARAAMGALGLPPVPLPRRPDCPPLWPRGVVGSLSHGGGAVLAAVARDAPGARALGLDLEPLAALPPEVADEVCGAGEDRAHALRVFGAKEAAGKALFMLAPRILPFDALRVTLAAGCFRAELLDPVPPFAPGLRLLGRQADVDGFLVSTLRIGDAAFRPAPSPRAPRAARLRPERT